MGGWRKLLRHQVNNRIYDCPDLGSFRRQSSGVTRKRNLWEIHRDPYDANWIWMRNHWETGWIAVPWKRLGSGPQPFGDLAWDHSAADLRREGKPNPAQEEIAGAVAALLIKASQGPADADGPSTRMSKCDRRAAARTRAAAENPGLWPPQLEALARPDADGPLADDDEEAVAGTDDEPIATVIPLGVFDPFKEADKRW